MKTLKDVFAAYRDGLLSLYAANEVEAITLLAINDITGFSKAKIKAFSEANLAGEQGKRLDDILIQLKTGKPIQYILGKTEFYGLPFMVNSSVLIPRPETEELVDWIISSVGSLKLAVGSILDIGTGSGCIAVSLKKHLPDFEVFAVDISSNALQTTKENAGLNNVEINLIEADILNHQALSQISNLKSQISMEGDILNSHSLSQISNLKSQISIIVSNPPYVTLQDKSSMHTNVTDFEPHTALFVPADDPLIFYKAIADFALKNLSPDGLLFFEINENYAEEIVELLNHKSFKNIELRKDLSSRDRMIKAQLPARIHTN